VCIEAAETLWAPFYWRKIAPHASRFEQRERTAALAATQRENFSRIAAGRPETTGSAFENFLKDEYTTLKEIEPDPLRLDPRDWLFGKYVRIRLNVTASGSL